MEAIASVLLKDALARFPVLVWSITLASDLRALSVKSLNHVHVKSEEESGLEVEISTHQVTRHSSTSSWRRNTSKLRRRR